MSDSRRCPCSCGSGLAGRYAQDDSRVVAFVCDDCEHRRLPIAIAEAKSREIAQVYKWWRDPALVHKMRRLLIEANYSSDQRVDRVQSLLIRFRWYKLPTWLELFFEKGDC